ncbi:hypothetical protein [Yinghuangia soli]|uniref:TIGR04222 domain-containing membrane protein n=1 Tax=Yinghuangia soli TaxID=2908204 RepID=A0AA41PYN5_9ACTN|nr:hypothetical protein [Yinghuangia soli]MCF2528349.1 hypothetical protein [Yinghuangia soli]
MASLEFSSNSSGSDGGSYEPLAPDWVLDVLGLLVVADLLFILSLFVARAFLMARVRRMAGGGARLTAYSAAEFNTGDLKPADVAVLILVRDGFAHVARDGLVRAANRDRTERPGDPVAASVYEALVEAGAAGRHPHSLDIVAEGITHYMRHTAGEHSLLSRFRRKPAHTLALLKERARWAARALPAIVLVMGLASGPPQWPSLVVIGILAWPAFCIAAGLGMLASVFFRSRVYERALRKPRRYATAYVAEWQRGFGFAEEQQALARSRQAKAAQDAAEAEERRLAAAASSSSSSSGGCGSSDSSCSSCSGCGGGGCS